MKMTEFRIKLADPGIDDSDELAAQEVLRSGWLVSGPQVAAFEKELAASTGRKFAVVTSSGTTALLAAMRALGVGPGKRVVVPALTFPAPAAVAVFLGAEIRVCDVDPQTLNLSAETLAPRLDESVSVVVAIDQFGNPAPVPEIEELARTFGATVLVDAACSLGSSLNGAPCGSLGHAATLSFHPRKVITTGEGGAVVTDDPELAQAVRQLENHGIDGSGFASIGINLRMGEVQAAIGRSQLGRLSEIIRTRQELAQGYAKLPLRFPTPPAGGQANFQTAAALLPASMEGKDRDELIASLAEQGIEATVASYCLALVPPLAAQLDLSEADTPVAREAHELGLALPLHPGLQPAEVAQVAAAVGRWLDERGPR